MSNVGEPSGDHKLHRLSVLTLYSTEFQFSYTELFSRFMCVKVNMKLDVTEKFAESFDSVEIFQPDEQNQRTSRTCSARRLF